MRSEKRGRRWVRRIAGAIGLLLVLAMLAGTGGALWFRGRLKASLPMQDGATALPGLSARVEVARDARGVVTLTASSRVDLARATGFVHAQDRFFQMDLLRRRAGGDLSALFGPAALPLDREVRVHGLRSVARAVVEAASARERAILEAYAEGVNAGLRALGSKPFEYVLLRAEPDPWKPEDSALVLLAMFLDLQGGDGGTESTLGLLHDLFPAPLADFIAPSGTEWDAPLEGEAFTVPPVPGSDVFDLRRKTALRREGSTPGPVSGGAAAVATSAPATEAIAAIFGLADDEPHASGSNSFAVDASRTADGRAIIANDMHLGLDVPNIWYRVSWVWREDAGSERVRRALGVTLPGTPALVAGSNTRIAWAFTNSYTDTSDLVLLEPGPSDGTYLTPEGPRAFERRTETIAVRGAPADTLEVLSTIWGPVLDEDHRKRRRALRWVAHDPRAVNFRLLELENAEDLGQAFRVAHTCGVPALNILIADSRGMIGWTICGVVPARRSDGTLPASWAKGSLSWDGWLGDGDAASASPALEGPRESPSVVAPPSGCLWTANARVVSGPHLKAVGDGGYDLGARARQIRDDLLARPRASEPDLLAVQLDDRAVFLERWRGRLLALLDERVLSADPRRREMREAVESWGGHAAIDSVGYRLVRSFRLKVADRVFEPFEALCREADRRFSYQRLQQYEGPLWALLEAKPPHLLNPKYESWEALQLASVDAVLAEMREIGPRLTDRTWGERNTVHIQHPLSGGLPLVGRWLDMPAVPLPGDDHMPRVQGRSFGASERFVVSPGHEEDALFQMPGGQSGNPLSPHYGDEQDDWAQGRPTRFLPGPATHTLILDPAK